MPDALDITGFIERMDALEERCGVTFEALSASARTTDNTCSVQVHGEVHPLSGESLKQTVTVVVAAYDSAGRVLETAESHRIYAEEWWGCEPLFGFEAFSLAFQTPTMPAKLRLYPK